MRTHHVVDGPAAAPAVVLVHPLGVTHRLWDAAAAALRDRYRVVRYDVRGHGASATPPGPYSLAEMAEDTRELLDALALGTVHVVGDRLRVAETRGMTAELVERTLAIWFSAESHVRHPDDVARIAAMLRATDPNGYAASIRAIGWADQHPQLGAIQAPTLVVVGENDPGTPVAMSREIVARIGGARLVVLPGAMHCSPVESADAFPRELRAFLDGVA